MKTVSHLLKDKSAEIITVRPNDSVYVALQVMATYNVGALPVVGKEGLMGIFSERDYARKVALNGLTSSITEVRDIMSSQVITAHLGQTVMDCMNLMTERHIRHLPVVDDSGPLGFISIGDLVKYRIERIETEAEAMRSYIQSA